MAVPPTTEHPSWGIEPWNSSFTHEARGRQCIGEAKEPPEQWLKNQGHKADSNMDRTWPQLGCNNIEAVPAQEAMKRPTKTMLPWNISPPGTEFEHPHSSSEQAITSTIFLKVKSTLGPNICSNVVSTAANTEYFMICKRFGPKSCTGVQSKKQSWLGWICAFAGEATWQRI